MFSHGVESRGISNQVPSISDKSLVVFLIDLTNQLWETEWVDDELKWTDFLFSGHYSIIICLVVRLLYLFVYLI